MKRIHVVLIAFPPTVYIWAGLAADKDSAIEAARLDAVLGGYKNVADAEVLGWNWLEDQMVLDAASYLKG